MGVHTARLPPPATFPYNPLPFAKTNGNLQTCHHLLLPGDTHTYMLENSEGGGGGRDSLLPHACLPFMPACQWFAVLLEWRTQQDLPFPLACLLSMPFPGCPAACCLPACYHWFPALDTTDSQAAHSFGIQLALGGFGRRMPACYALYLELEVCEHPMPMPLPVCCTACLPGIILPVYLCPRQNCLPTITLWSTTGRRWEGQAGGGWCRLCCAAWWLDLLTCPGNWEGFWNPIAYHLPKWSASLSSSSVSCLSSRINL